MVRFSATPAERVGADLWGWHSNVAGQRYAKLAMEAAATGAHNIVTYFTNATYP
jgi:predicted ATPase with chaperone activity